MISEWPVSSDVPKDSARDMDLEPESTHALLRQLILDGLFDSPVRSTDVVRRIAEKFGTRIRTSYIQTYMRKFMEHGVIQAIKPQGSTSNYYVITSVSRADAASEIGKDRRTRQVEQQLFSPGLLRKLGSDFSADLSELHANFGKHGNATAFLLRKILEKLLIIVFGKLGRISAIEDKRRPGGWRGLQEIVDIAAQEKVAGLPVLLPKTANEIRGLKFLGDTAAHNPLTNVNMLTILPQMPFLITAFEELARHL
jgi:hypothetical protein